MLVLKSLLLTTLLLATISLHAQQLSDFRWEHRLVLLIAEDTDNALLKKQLNELKADEEGLIDRKLLVIQINPSNSQILIPKDQSEQISPTLYQQFKQGKYSFSFVLIGLDGGVKLKRNEVVSREYLYALIDGMPMRRAEMREKKN